MIGEKTTFNAYAERALEASRQKAEQAGQPRQESLSEDFQVLLATLQRLAESARILVLGPGLDLADKAVASPVTGFLGLCILSEKFIMHLHARISEQSDRMEDRTSTIKFLKLIIGDIEDSIQPFQRLRNYVMDLTK